MNGDEGDLYSVLGLTPGATPVQVRRAYRSLLRQNHPDTRSPGGAASDALFQRAIAAYAILGDPGRRLGYDQRTAREDRVSPVPVPVRRTTAFMRGGPTPSPIRAGRVHWQPDA